MSAATSTIVSSTRATRDVLHGVVVEDPFRWLEDQNSSATRDFICSEWRRYARYLEDRYKLRCIVEKRVTELLTVESVDLPNSDNRGGLLYLKRLGSDEQRSLYHDCGTGEERVLVSYEAFGLGGSISLTLLRVSRSGRYLILGVRSGGEDVQEVRIYDVDLGVLLEDVIPKGYFRGLEFAPDEKSFYYVQEELDGPYLLRRAVRSHCLATEQSGDRELFYAGEGPSLRLGIQGSSDGSVLGYSIIALEAEAHNSFLLHRRPFVEPPKDIAAVRGASFACQLDGDDRVLAMTTLGAVNGRIVTFPWDSGAPTTWKEVIPTSLGRISGFERCNDLLIVHYDSGPEAYSEVFDLSGAHLRSIRYPSSGTCRIGRSDATKHRLFYEHSSVEKPPSIYEVDLDSGVHSLWWRQNIPAPKQQPTVEQHLYPSADGTRIPLTIVGAPKSDGPRPLLLSAYGSGGVKTAPNFSVLISVLLEAGFRCATAHIRGGGEGGVAWHLAAQGKRKQTSVDDLIAGAEWLLSQGYATAEQLGLAGQSHGALMVLCALTQRPDLFGAVVALGPLADLTRFHLFGVGRSFVLELGHPDREEDFGALYQLSPYHRVVANAAYPAVLIISGDRDKRCDALHARKMVARLQQTTRPRGPILLDYLEERGHKAVLPLSVRIRSLTDRLTFLISELSFESEPGGQL